MRPWSPVLALLVLAACPAADDAADTAADPTTGSTGTSGVDATTDETEGATSMASGSTSADPCAGIELPLCDFCPASMGTLCGLPCDDPGQTCSNEIGDGMACEGGQWSCAVHPPLGTGCNLVCEPAEACTEIGCSDGLTIALTPDEDGVTAGSYTVSIDADGAVEDCTLEISEDPMVCEGGVPCVPETTCNAIVLLDPDGTIEIGVAVAAEVTVSVARDAEPAVEVSEAPSYDVAAPNGPGCPPACAFGRVTVAGL